MSEPDAPLDLEATVEAPTTTNPYARASSSEASLDAETLAGRYELVSLLGSGGMGAVYKARDLELGELVALKMLRPELSTDATMIARFRQEVKLARRVTHANVARTFDIGEHGSQRFLTMELIVGDSLTDVVLREGIFPLARVVEIASAVCGGLVAAHRAGVVHRDLKPDNVLLGADGRIVVTDFGIARVDDPVQHEAVKTIGNPLGTPAYMAPEQVEGAADVDSRADIYALGAMLYELFTGQRAWQGDSVYWIASRRLVEPPPDPRALRPDLPPAASQIVLKCMARHKADRFQSASDVASALAGMTAVPVTASVPKRGAAPPSRTKSVAVLPFRNTGAPGDEYLAEGLTDDLIDVLSMTRGVRVCARGVATSRAGGDPREIGRALGVDAVVEGSLRRAAGQLRVTARVLGVADGFQLWAERFDRDAGAFFEVNDVVARAVAEALTCKLDQALRSPVADPVALDLYLRARHEYFKYWRDSVIEAVRLFVEALARTPDDPMILAGYAMALARRMGHDDGTDADAEAAHKAAERALAIDSRSATARTALAYEQFLLGRSVAAATSIRSVVTDHPDSADALELAGRILVECGPASEGTTRLLRAVELEPLAVTVRMEIAKVHALLGDRAGCEAFLGDPPADPGLAPIYWITRCRTALWLRDSERPKAWRAVLEATPDVHPGALMMVRALTGDPPTDEQMLALHSVNMSGLSLLRRRAIHAQIVCEFATYLGRTEVALDALESADAGRLFDATWIQRCSTLAPLRTSPRFIAVRDRVLARAGEVRAALGIG